MAGKRSGEFEKREERGRATAQGNSRRSPAAIRPSATTVVLCGGGARGAVEVGFYRALCELDIRIKGIFAASVGALNGAAIAAGLTPAELTELWLGIRRQDIIGKNWRSLLRPWAFDGPYTLDPLRRLLADRLPTTRFDDLKLPLTIATTNLQTGAPSYWSDEGDLLEPLIASMSLPGVFPPVDMDGAQHIDGGIANNVPLDRAVEAGASAIMLILCTCCPIPSRRLRNVLEITRRSFAIALDCKYRADIKHYGEREVAIHVVVPRVDVDVDLLNFDHTKRLIDAGYQQTMAYFEQSDQRLENSLPSSTGMSGEFPDVEPN